MRRYFRGHVWFNTRNRNSYALLVRLRIGRDYDTRGFSAVAELRVFTRQRPNIDLTA